MVTCALFGYSTSGRPNPHCRSIGSYNGRRVRADLRNDNAWCGNESELESLKGFQIDKRERNIFWQGLPL
jgi:hypothetical protein